MESYDIFCFIMGIGVGFVIAAVSIGQKIPPAASNKNSIIEENDKEKKDPANWWKYGGDPFDYE